MQIKVDDLTHPDVLALLDEHLADMRAQSPPECVFALDLPRLNAADITFWTAWQDGVLMGCGALKALTPTHGELKSMQTPTARRGHRLAVLGYRDADRVR